MNGLRASFATMVVTAAICAAAVRAAAESPRSLAGRWRFALDAEDAGIAQEWWKQTLADEVHLPGSLQEQGKGNLVSVDTDWTGRVRRDWFTAQRYARYRRPGNIKVPFWLQPQRHYVGPAWYQRDIDIPAAWRGRRVELFLERAHWQTAAWLDDRELGVRDSLSTPHVYELGDGLTPGRHRITVRVDNRVLVPVGVNAHSVSDHTQTNWNGLVGRLELRSTTPVWIADAQAYPDISTRSARLRVKVGNATEHPGRGVLTVNGESRPVTWTARGAELSVTVELDRGARLWDEFSPSLQSVSLSLQGGQADDRRTVRFGLREWGVDGTQFTINGRKTFLRGTVECCVFPLTGYPPTDVAAWRRVLSIIKDHGLNHVRFHSWCPPEAAFEAADELGVYFQVECAAWTNVGDGQPQDKWLYEEGRRIERCYGNHPSFSFMAYGNEPHGRKRDTYLSRWVRYWREHAPRQLHTSGSGWPMLSESDYHVTPRARGTRGWHGRDFADFVAKQEKPIVSHEIGQWCAYPDFDEIRKYTGVLRARNFEIFRDSLAAHGMLQQARDFLRASGELQAVCYKAEVEAALRTPGMAGFQILQVNDFPGQGTALVGWRDAFWDDKGYLSATAFRRFGGSTALLARLAKRTWTQDETLQAEFEVAHFGPRSLGRVTPMWKLIDASGKAVRQGTLPPLRVGLGNGIRLGRASVPLTRLPAPARYRLALGFAGSPYGNGWDVWVYPAQVDIGTPDGVVVSDAFDEPARTVLARGGRAVLLVDPMRLKTSNPSMSFTPVFWNRQWFPTQRTQTLGVLVQSRHPALNAFPTDFHADWQWEDLLSRGRAAVLDDLPRDLQPIVQAIDDWNTNRKLGLVFECQVDAGRLLVCTLDLSSDLDARPAARQLRHSLLRYADSDMFRPRVRVPLERIAALFREPSVLQRLGATVTADSEDRAHGNVAGNAIDGRANTIWHTRWQPRNDPMPHQLTIDMKQQVAVHGITYLPRQDMSNGRIARFEVRLSADGKSWGAPVASGHWSDSPEQRTVRFRTPARGRFLRLVVLSEVRGRPFASAAEIDIIPSP